MAKSFCAGCRFWTVAKEFDGSKFHYCFKLKEYALYNRKKLCNGKLREEEDKEEAIFEMSRLMVASQQELSFLRDYIVSVDVGIGNDVGVETTWKDGKIIKAEYEERKL